MKVQLKYGHCKYEGERHIAGDTFDVSDLFYQTNQSRFDVVQKKKAKKAKKPEVEPSTEVESEPEAD